ncbi:MAG: hypothetical protein R3E66_00440 [bacterium]
METIHEGGTWTWLLLSWALISHTFAAAGGLACMFVGHRWVRQVRLGVGAILLFFCIVAVGLGLAGYYLGMQEMQEALQVVIPKYEEQLRAEGTRLARIPLYIGAATAILPGLVGAAAIAFGLRRPKANEEEQT